MFLAKNIYITIRKFNLVLKTPGHKNNFVTAFRVLGIILIFSNYLESNKKANYINSYYWSLSILLK